MWTLFIKTESGERTITSPDVLSPIQVEIEDDGQQQLPISTLWNNGEDSEAQNNSKMEQEDPLKDLQEEFDEIVAQLISDVSTTQVIHPEELDNQTQIKMEVADEEFMVQTEAEEDIKTEIIPPVSIIKTEKDEPRPAPKSRPNALKNTKGYVIKTVTKTRIILCKLCLAQVPTLTLLMVHLDREHNIRALGPPRVVDELDVKEDLKNTSNLLKAIENKPRTVEVLSAAGTAEESDSDSSSDEVNDFSDNEESYSSPSPISSCPEESYLKLKSRMVKVLAKREIRNQRCHAAFIQQPKSQLEINKSIQCSICWIECSRDERFAPLRWEHARQHQDGEFKVCPHCGMGFLYEHYLEKHLDDLRVPVVPPHFTPSEEEDLLYLSHSCPVVGCHAEFNNRKCLLFHRTKEHDHLHRCPTCEKSFVMYSRLRRHIERTHNYEKRQLPCPIPLCDKSFSTRKGISSHMMHVHTKEEKKKWYIPSKKSATGSGDNGLSVSDPKEENNPQPPIIISHRPPQTFWTLKNAQLLMTLARRAKRDIIFGKRNKEPVLPTHASLPPPKAEKVYRPRPKSVAMAMTRRLSTTSSSSSEKVFSSSRDGEVKVIKVPTKLLISLPPRTNVADITKRNRPRHALFGCLCCYCSRSFRYPQDRDNHFASVHNINMKLERPHLCPVPDCKANSYSQCGYLIFHIRQFHPPSVEEELFRRSLEQDKLAQEMDNCSGSRQPVNVPIVKENEPGVELSSEEEEEEQKSIIITKPPVPHSKTNRRVKRSTFTMKPKRKKKELCRRSRSALWKPPIGPKCALIRQVLSNFKFASGLYCPECPLDKQKSFKNLYNLHRHMDLIHPNSEILTNPGTAVLPGESGVMTKSASSPAPSTSGEDEEQELDPSSFKQELSNYDDDNKVKDDKKVKDVDLSARHDSNSDEDDEELDPSLKCGVAPPPPPEKIPLAANDLITPASSQGMLAILRKFFTVSNTFKPRYPNDTRMTCPSCPPEKTFCSVHNLQRHFFRCHKGSEYLNKSKLDGFIQVKEKENEARGRQFKEGVPYTILKRGPPTKDKVSLLKRKKTIKRKKATSVLPPKAKDLPGSSLKLKAEVADYKEEEETTGAMNCSSEDDSDMEVAPPPKLEKSTTLQEVIDSASVPKDGAKALNQYKLSQNQKEDHDLKVFTNNVVIKEEPIEFPHIPSDHDNNNHYEDLSIRKSKRKRHIKPEIKEEYDSSDTLFTPIIKKSKRRKAPNPKYTSSTTTPPSTSEQAAITALGPHILPLINPTKIQCPYCPLHDHNNKEKYTYPSYHTLLRHLSRCQNYIKAKLRESDASTFFISSLTGQPELRKWACNWCARRFGGKQHLTMHVTTLHPSITSSQYNEYVITLQDKMEVFVCDKCGRRCKTRNGLELHSCRRTAERGILTTPGKLPTFKKEIVQDQDVTTTSSDYLMRVASFSPRCSTRPQPKYYDSSSSSSEGVEDLLYPSSLLFQG